MPAIKIRTATGWETVNVQRRETVLMDSWHLVGAANEPIFENSWRNYAADTVNYGLAGFRKFPDGRVRLRGLIEAGVANTRAFRLPVGYRPTRHHHIICAASDEAAQVRVDSDGQVLVSTNPGWVDLASVEFDTESVVALPTGGVAALEPWRELGAAGQPALGSGWVNYGSGHENAKFAKDSLGFVHLTGLIKNGTLSAAMFTLPEGYRPHPLMTETLIFPVRTSVGAGELRVNRFGQPFTGTTNGWVSLQGVYWRAES